MTRVTQLYLETLRGPRTIEQLLFEEGIKISHMSIYRYLVSEGLIIPKKKKKKRKDPLLHICEIPGEEMQLDVMHVDPLPGTGDGHSRKGFHYQYTLVDDCTKVQYATLFPNLSQINTCEFLDRIVSKTPFPVQKIRMDNGGEFQTKVRDFLKVRHINWIYNTSSRPDQNGKVERAHRTTQEEYYIRSEATTFQERLLRLTNYLIYYNNKRPHWGLGMNGKTPLNKLQSFEKYKSVTLIV